MISTVRGRAVGAGALGADRAEALALRPHRVGPAVEQRLDLRRAGVGGEVEVVAGRLDAEQEVADRPADEVEPVPGRGEALGQRRQLGEHGGEAGGDHAAGQARGEPARVRRAGRRGSVDVPARWHGQTCGNQCARDAGRRRRGRGRRCSAPRARTSTPAQRAEHAGGAGRQGVEVVAALEHRQRPPGRHHRHRPARQQRVVAGASGRARSAGRRGGRRSRPRSAATSARTARRPARSPRRTRAGRRRRSRRPAAGRSASCRRRRRSRSR